MNEIEPKYKHSSATAGLRSEKSRGIVAFVEEEIKQYEVGKIDRLSSNEDLRAQFDYATTASFYNLLHKTGLFEQRRQLMQSLDPKRDISLSPSAELAWLLGLFTGGGHVNSQSGEISLSSYYEPLLNRFKKTGEQLFMIPGKFYSRVQQKDLTEYGEIRFHSTKIATSLGDFRSPTWARILRQTHEWVFSQGTYVWDFLSGAFETKGTTVIIDERPSIRFSEKYRENAELLAEILKLAGVENPRIVPSKNDPMRTEVVQITSIENAKSFSQHIHSFIPGKESKLEYCRNYQQKAFLSTEAELVAEYRLVRELSLKELNRLPSMAYFDQLRSKGIIKHTAATFAYRFGRKCFPDAIEYLESLMTNIQTETNSSVPEIASCRVDRVTGLYYDTQGADWAQVGFFEREIKIHRQTLTRFLEEVPSIDGLNKYGQPCKLYQVEAVRKALKQSRYLDTSKGRGSKVGRKKLKTASFRSPEQMKEEVKDLYSQTGSLTYSAFKNSGKLDLYQAICKQAGGINAARTELGLFPDNTKGESIKIDPKDVLALSLDRRQDILDQYNAFIKANPYTKLGFIEFASQYLGKEQDHARSHK